LLVKTFDTSQFGSDLLIRRPELLEEITRSETLNRSISTKEHLNRLAALRHEPGNLDGLRLYRQTQLLRILLRDVLDLLDLSELMAEHSALSEASLLAANKQVGNEELTIIALGKFGGTEIGYGADLDVLFVGDESRAAQHLSGAMSQPSAAGNLPVLDARLRPDGEKGPLVVPLDAYDSYYGTRAQLWEIHALTLARPITGPLQNQFMDVAQSHWKKTSERADLFAQIDAMLERIRRERSSGSDLLDLKTGAGGIIEAEFLVQALQMKAGIWEPNWHNALKKLAGEGVMTAREAAEAKRGYEFLRWCESALRRWENKSVSVLPSGADDQRKFAKRLDYGDFDLFLAEYAKAREVIHAVYERRISKTDFQKL
jgi:glutamate-ammonia-ligase adenylyltransferase